MKFDKANELLMVKWNDNAQVHVATNYSDVAPPGRVERYSSKEKKRIKVQQLKMIGDYNAHMGGVDHHDWLAAHYAIGIRGKKWYFPLITHGIQMAVVNAWLIYKRVNPTAVPLLQFTRCITTEYMALTQGTKVVLSRPRAPGARATARATPSGSGGRYDNIGHFPAKRTNKRRCQGDGCKSRPLTFCAKCDVILCSNCFTEYHKK